MHLPNAHDASRSGRNIDILRQVLRTPQYIIEKYLLTFFASAWLLPTPIHGYIKGISIIVSLFADIGINWQNNNRVISVRPMRSIVFVFIALIVLAIWKSCIDAHYYLFTIEPVGKVYDLINRYNILIGSSEIAKHPCLQWGTFVLIEKILLHISLAFVGLVYLRWVKLRLYEIFRDKPFYQVSFIGFWLNELVMTVASYLSVGFIVYVIYFIYSQYCRTAEKAVPIIILYMTILFVVTVYSINVFKIFRTRRKRT